MVLGLVPGFGLVGMTAAASAEAAGASITVCIPAATIVESITARADDAAMRRLNRRLERLPAVCRCLILFTPRCEKCAGLGTASNEPVSGLLQSQPF